jgi:peptide/nickel transport system permease protein
VTRGEKAAAAALVALVVVAAAASHLASDDGGGLLTVGPSTQDLASRLVPPLTAGRPLGGDAMGRDVLARLLHGLRTSLLAAFGGAAISFGLGLLIGAAAGSGRTRFGRALGFIPSVVADAGAAFPALFTAIALQAALRPGVFGLALILGVLRAPTTARLVRQEARRVAAAPFVLAAHSAGVPAFRVFWRHVMPHAATPALIAAAFAAPGNVLAEAALGFLGVGLPEPAASIGSLLRDGRLATPYASHLVWIPGLVAAVLTLSCQTLAEGARRRAAATAEGASS